MAGRGSMAATAAWWRQQAMRVHHGAPVGRSRRGRGCARGCVCTQRPKTALAYVLPVWSAMADMVRSGGEQGNDWGGLTVGVMEDWMVTQWRVAAV